MKNKKIVSMAALIAASLSAAHAQTITAWTFDNIGAATSVYNPAPSTGSGLANAAGMSNSYNNTNSISNPDVLSTTGSSSTGTAAPDAWRVRGAGAVPNSGNGWSSSAPIGTQGAQFATDTTLYNNITISFDINTTAQAERNLAILYTLDDTVGSPTWLNATITSAGSGSIQTGSGVNTVGGNYVQLSSTAGWNNGITASFPGVSADPNFAVEIVNASTGSDNVNISGAAYNNTSGNWRYDNVIIGGTLIPAPEPTTLALAGLGGLAALVAVRRRK